MTTVTRSDSVAQIYNLPIPIKPSGEGSEHFACKALVQVRVIMTAVASTTDKGTENFWLVEATLLKSEQPEPTAEFPVRAIVYCDDRQTEAPAPAINVNVSPTPVTIKNEVKVPAASRATIGRNDNGKMTHIDIART